MTQEAVVTKLLPNNMAEVAVTRTTACGSNCGSCESCIFQNELKTYARNIAGAKQGQHVVIESKSSEILGAAILVYIIPVVMFLAGYILAYLAGAKEAVCVIVSFLAFLTAGMLIVAVSHRKNKKNITFDIIQIK